MEEEEQVKSKSEEVRIRQEAEIKEELERIERLNKEAAMEAER